MVTNPGEEDHRQALAAVGIAASMSCPGDRNDDAAIESFWHGLTNELVRRQRFPTRATATTTIFRYVETFYDRVRRHRVIGQASPTALQAAHADFQEAA